MERKMKKAAGLRKRKELTQLRVTHCIEFQQNVARESGGEGFSKMLFINQFTSCTSTGKWN
jgi:hypothetical protein